MVSYQSKSKVTKTGCVVICSETSHLKFIAFHLPKLMWEGKHITGSLGPHTLLHLSEQFHPLPLSEDAVGAGVMKTHSPQTRD